MAENLDLELLAKKYDVTIEPGKDYRLKENHWLPRKIGIRYFAFGKTLYCNGSVEVIPDHELLHVAQFKKYGKVRVIGHYLFHFVKNYAASFSPDRSFADIPFEVEARYYEQHRKNKASYQGQSSNQADNSPLDRKTKSVQE